MKPTKSMRETTSYKLVTAVVRHSLTIGGGFLIAKGISPEITGAAITEIAGPLTELVVGGTMSLVAVAWSIIRKLPPKK